VKVDCFQARVENSIAMANQASQVKIVMYAKTATKPTTILCIWIYNYKNARVRLASTGFLQSLEKESAPETLENELMNMTH
jgi:hypothetical protein